MTKEQFNPNKSEQRQKEMRAEWEQIYSGGKDAVEGINSKITPVWNRAKKFAKDLGIIFYTSPKWLPVGAKEVGRSLKEDFFGGAIRKLKEVGAMLSDKHQSRRRGAELETKDGIGQRLGEVGSYAEGLEVAATQVKERADEEIAAAAIEAEKRMISLAGRVRGNLDKYGGTGTPKLGDLLGEFDTLIQKRESDQLGRLLREIEPEIQAHKSKVEHERTVSDLITGHL